MIWVGWRQQRTETLIAAGDARPARRAARPDRPHDGLRLRPRRALRVRCGAARSAAASRRSTRSRARFDAARRTCSPGSRSFPALIGVAARGAVRPRARARHLPARLDAEHHAPPLDRRKLGLDVRRGRARCARADRAHDLVADAARPPARTHGDDVFDFEGTVGFGYVLFALGLVARHRRRLAADRAGADRRLRGLRRRARLRPDTGCASATSRRSSITWPRAQRLREAASSSKAWILERVAERPPRARDRGPLSPLRTCETSRRRRRASRSSIASCLPSRSSTTTPSTSRRAGSGSSRASRPRSSAASALALILFAAWWVHERVT